MIFGIKTKKDKKIEELQKEIDKLKFQPPKIIKQSIMVSTIGASYLLHSYDESIISESRIKSVLAGRLSQELIKTGLPIEKIKLHDGNVWYRVRLKVILNDIYRN
nr:MAG TPA: hypothetical protein [Caudoviricetes sp.]